MAVRVLIADDQALIRAGFSKLLDAEDEIDVVGEAVDGADAVEAVRRLRPDVVLMDIRMPKMDGLEATRGIVKGAVDTRVLIVTTYDLDEYVYEALKAGASGFVLKDSPPDQLINAIRVIAAGDALLAPSITRRLIQEFANRPQPHTDPRLSRLTPRETEVLKLLSHGYSNAEIAAELVLGEATVKTHVGNVLTKLGVRDRAQAVVFGYESGLVQPGIA